MRTVEDVLTEARTLDWSVWEVPASDRLWTYKPEMVPAAFDAIPAVADEADAQAAYNTLLDALAHNHSVTPYPAMVPGVRLLSELVPLLAGWQLATVVEVLTECFLWTGDEGVFTAKDGRTYNLAGDTAAAVRSVRPALEQLAQRRDAEPARRGVADLLRALGEQEPLTEAKAVLLRRPWSWRYPVRRRAWPCAQADLEQPPAAAQGPTAAGGPWSLLLPAAASGRTYPPLQDLPLVVA